MVAERLLSAVMRSSSPEIDMSFFISYDAHDIFRKAIESTLRCQKGKPISVLDGVPIAIKDEIDCMPYPTTGRRGIHMILNVSLVVHPVDQLLLCVQDYAQLPLVLMGEERSECLLLYVVSLVSSHPVGAYHIRVGMVGVLAGTVEDSLIVYAAISDEANLHQPTTVPAFIL